MLESVQMGNLEITKCMSTDLSFYVEESAIFGLPYIFTSLEHMDACLIGGLRIGSTNLLAEKDLVVIAWLDAGSRSVYNSKNAINKMEDMNGLLLRVPETMCLCHQWPHSVQRAHLCQWETYTQHYRRA